MDEADEHIDGIGQSLICLRRPSELRSVENVGDNGFRVPTRHPPRSTICRIADPFGLVDILTRDRHDQVPLS
ncbi:MAG: hypothetical protein ACTIIT_14740, partial [Brevibacterium linens]